MKSALKANFFDVYIVVKILLFKVLFYWLCLLRNVKFVFPILFAEKTSFICFKEHIPVSKNLFLKILRFYV
jgi:hypothetical protein